jgi:flagellar hook-associated protein 1
MSITGAMNSALSGMTAVARSASVVSSNTANALTEGYARREVTLTSMQVGTTGTGVRVAGVNRVVNQTVVNDLRLAEADLGNSNIRTDFLSGVETMVGESGEPGSLSALLAGFDSSLISAASRPDSDARLTSLLNAAQGVASQLNKISDNLMQVRTSADDQIANQVDTLNSSLKQIAQLNRTITAQQASGVDAGALLDQRQLLIDQVSAIVPVREVARENGQIALFSTGGAVLLEGSKASEIGFDPAGLVTADMTLASGALSGLTLNGMSVSTADDKMMGGGSLGALFAVRDDLAPQAQSQVDAFARDLISRFQDPAVDPTLTAGDPGLFTDKGAALDTTLEVGLAGRIEINALVDPAQGGAIWRLRDGLGAAAPGAVGDSTLLTALGNALTDPRAPASGNFSGTQKSSSGLAADILSQISSARQTSETQQAYSSSRQSTLKELFLADGVDTDQEMQKLMQIEQAYAANAKVMSAMDDLLQTLLGM